MMWGNRTEQEGITNSRREKQWSNGQCQYEQTMNIDQERNNQLGKRQRNN